jgi:hypothetical protein
MFTRINLILSFILFSLFVSCKKASKEQLFVDKYQLGKYDTIVLVSTFSCGGCIAGFATHSGDSPDKVFVYDSSCKSKFISALMPLHSFHLPQSSMDNIFGKFGNIILLTKVKGQYISEELADMQ